MARHVRFVPMVAVALALVTASPAFPAPGPSELVIEPTAWRVVKSESGPLDYYTVQSEGATRFVHARYLPPMKTTVLGYQIPEADRQRVRGPSAPPYRKPGTA